MKAMSGKQYRKEHGARCPNCHSNNISGNGAEETGDDATMYVPIICKSCNATWTDTYRLTGYVELKTVEGLHD
jgi:transposase-like protein